MNKLKLLLITFLSVFLLNITNSQNCYEVIADMSGIDISSYQSELEAVACELVEAFPEEFQNQFKVYDYGFFRMNEFMQGGFQTVWDKVIDDIPTPYYLVFGKQSDQTGIYTKFWVDIKLPDTGAFECLGFSSGTVRQDIVNKYNIKANEIYKNYGKAFQNYSTVEIEVIHSLKEFIEEKINCCEQAMPSRSSSSCLSCIFSPDELFKLQLSYLFIIDPVYITNDPDYLDVSSIASNENRSSNDSLNIDIKFLDEQESSLDEFIFLYKNVQITDIFDRTGISTDISVHTFKYPRDCGAFSEKWNQYQDDESEYKVFISLINFNNEVGALGYHSTVQSLGGGNRSANNADILEDEMLGINQITEDFGSTCDDLLHPLASMLASSGTMINRFAPAIVTDPEVQRINYEVFEEAKNRFEEASYEIGIYWAREYEVVKKKMNCSDWNWSICAIHAKWRTTDNICGEVVHTLLDICGLFPVVGEVCDVTNAVLYFSSGDLTNATLSSVAVVPIAGYGAFGVKYGGKLWRPVTGCVTEGRSGANYCRLLSFIVSKEGLIKWRGKNGQLRDIIVKNDVRYAFNGIDLIYDGTKHNAHHLIPWEKCINEKNKELMKELATRGWHPNNPSLNGLVVPKMLPNGSVFHYGNHKAYNDWIEKILPELESLPKNQLMNKIQAFNNHLKYLIQDAYQKNMSINSYFKDLEKIKIEDL